MSAGEDELSHQNKFEHMITYKRGVSMPNAILPLITLKNNHAPVISTSRALHYFDNVNLIEQTNNTKRRLSSQDQRRRDSLTFFNLLPLEKNLNLFQRIDEMIDNEDDQFNATCYNNKKKPNFKSVIQEEEEDEQQLRRQRLKDEQNIIFVNNAKRKRNHILQQQETHHYSRYLKPYFTKKQHLNSIFLGKYSLENCSYKRRKKIISIKIWKINSFFFKIKPQPSYCIIFLIFLVIFFSVLISFIRLMNKNY